MDDIYYKIEINFCDNRNVMDTSLSIKPTILDMKFYNEDLSQSIQIKPPKANKKKELDVGTLTKAASSKDFVHLNMENIERYKKVNILSLRKSCSEDRLRRAQETRDRKESLDKSK